MGKIKSPKMSQRQRRDQEVMQATFGAISAALGWDRPFPRKTLWQSVEGRLKGMNPMHILLSDEALGVLLNSSQTEVDQAEGGICLVKNS